MKKYLIAVLIVLLGVGLWAFRAFASSSGPNLPTSSVYQNDGDGWSSTSNIEACNGTPAIASSFHSGFAYSGSLYTEGYGFAIPTGATINGITAAVTARGDIFAGSPLMEDYVIQLLKGGSLVGSNLGSAVNQIPNATSTISYGGASNLWGTTWTSSDINSSNFGIDLNYQETGPTGANVYADCVTITVNYTAVAGTHASVTLKSGKWVIKNSTVIIN